MQVLSEVFADTAALKQKHRRTHAHARCVQGWEELMLVVESSMAGGRKEVALAAIAVITTVMQAHGTTKAVSRR